MWLKPGHHAEGVERAGAGRADRRRTPAPSISRGSSTHHWIHGCSSTCERRRRVAADRVPDASARRSTTLSKECSSPTTNSSISAGGRGRAARPRSHSLELLGRLDAEGALAPGAGRRLDDEREADRSRELPTPPRRCEPGGGGRTARRRPAARPSSAPCRGSCGRSRASMPGMPSCSRTSASGTWSCSRMLSARSTEPSRRPASRTPSASWPASRQSSTRTYVASDAAGFGTFSGGSLPTRATRTSGKRTAASTNRIVASRKYGATNTTLGTGRGQ